MVALALTAIVAPFATDMYLPALPSMARDFDAGAPLVQLTLTTFLVGFAVAQLICGPLSDVHGRRVFLLVGSAAFILFSVACALTHDAVTLILLRFFQGAAGAVPTVVGRAVISDVWGAGIDATRKFATIGTLGPLAPVVAPTIGAGIVTLARWPYVFAALAAFGVVMITTIIWGVPESLPPGSRAPLGIRSSVAAMASLMRQRRFLLYVTVSGLTMGSFFVYLSGASFVFGSVYGIPPDEFAVIFAGNALGSTLAALIFRRMVRRVLPHRSLMIGLLGASAAAVSLVVASMAGHPPFWVTAVLLGLVISALGLIGPAVVAMTQVLGAKAPGSASAVLGCAQFAVGAVVAPVTGIVGYRSIGPMAIAICCLLLAAAFAGWMAWPRDTAPISFRVL